MSEGHRDAWYYDVLNSRLSKASGVQLAEEGLQHLQGEVQRMLGRECQLRDRLHSAQEDLAALQSKYDEEAEKVSPLTQPSSIGIVPGQM